MKHHVVKPAPANVFGTLRTDPALRAIYRAKTLAELEALIDGMTAAQRNVALAGLIKLAWVQMRKQYKV
jgi:hypothetical protein